MTTRRTRKPRAAKAEEPTQEKNEYKIPQDELETFFTDPEPSEEEVVEVKELPTKKVRPAKSNVVFLGEEDIRDFQAYKKFLREEKGLKEIKHKKI